MLLLCTSGPVPRTFSVWVPPDNTLSPLQSTRRCLTKCTHQVPLHPRAFREPPNRPLTRWRVCGRSPAGIMPHALQPWASLRSYGIWMRRSCTSSKPAVIVCQVAHACTRPQQSAVSPPKESAHSGACSAAAASARDRLRGRRGCALRAHARHCDDARGRAPSRALWHAAALRINP